MRICLFILVALGPVVGCSGTNQEAEVSGTVTLDAKSIGPGIVVFAPIEGKTPATGTIEPNGNYSLKTSRETGLAAGKYRASVSIREMPATVNPGDRPPPGKLLIPEKYELSTTSGLEYDVMPGSNTIDIALSSQ
jgi:hypothetical protein